MNIRIELYEGSGRIFVDGVIRQIPNREIDIEDFFPLLRELGATVEAYQWGDDSEPEGDSPNDATADAYKFA
jgi:hypothetical protein